MVVYLAPSMRGGGAACTVTTIMLAAPRVVSVPWEVGGYTPIGRSSERESGGYAGVGILSL